MANAPEVKRNYSMADADLIQEADDKTNIASRDLADLQPRGLAPARITALKTARDTFSNFPTDEELKGDVTNAVAAKDALRVQLETSIADIRGMAQNRFEGTGYYNSFGFEGLTNLSDNKLARAARRIARVATTLQPQMTTQGLTPAIIAALKTLTDNFDNSIEAIGAAQETRDLKTQDRVAAGNATYALLIEIANIGQRYYITRDEAKYNDYVLKYPVTPPADEPNGPVTPPPPNA